MERSSHGQNKGNILALPGRTEKTMRNNSQNSQSPGQDLNLGLPKYKAGVIPLGHHVLLVEHVEYIWEYEMHTKF
jgi:hypothetical protein